DGAGALLRAPPGRSWGHRGRHAGQRRGGGETGLHGGAWERADRSALRRGGRHAAPRALVLRRPDGGGRHSWLPAPGAGVRDQHRSATAAIEKKEADMVGKCLRAVAAGLLLLSLDVVPAAVAPVAAASQSFTTPGSASFVAPAGVTQLTAQVCGAQGGSGVP